MGEPISEDNLLKLMISDPYWCLFYQREKVKEMLPALAKAYLLVRSIEKDIPSHTHTWTAWVASASLFGGASHRSCQSCGDIQFLEGGSGG